MNAKEVLMQQVKDGLVQQYASNKDTYVIRYGGLMWSVSFDDKGEVIKCSPRDVSNSITSTNAYLDNSNLWNHHIVGVGAGIILLYIEPKNPLPWMKRNISSIPEFWWCIQRCWGDAKNDNKLMAVIDKALTTKHYSRTLDGEPTRVISGNVHEVHNAMRPA